MWRAVGLLLVALCIVTNASLILDDQCPTTNKQDEAYEITDGSGSIEIKLNDIPLQDDNGATLSDCNYPVGATVEVAAGECDITCQACDDFDNCCPVGYTITATVVNPPAQAAAEPEPVCPTSNKEDEYYYITDSLPYRWITTNSFELDGPNEATLSRCNYPLNKAMRISPGECDIICQACDSVTEKCCEVKYTIFVLDKKCSSEEVVSNGQFALDSLGGRLIGDTATITCDDDFAMNGDPQVTCGSADGVDFESNQGSAQEVGQNDPIWLNMPSCGTTGDSDNQQRRGCRDPPSAGPSGSLSVSGTSIGDIATYNCDSGFRPAKVEATCTASLDSSFWSDGPPTCQDVDECTVNTDDCDSNAACENTVGSFTCDCNTGYTGSGRSCTPITCDYPEEERPFGSLSFSGTSLGDIATYTCDPGFQPALVESTCTASTDSADWSEGAPACRDVDECTVNTDDCDSNAACENTVGSFTCDCNTGYTGSGRSCTPILCADPVNGPNGAWQGSGRNVGDTVTYECSKGYQPARPDAIAGCTLSSDGQSASWSEDAPGCEDVDECADELDDCDSNAACGNTDGSFNCNCNPGYFGGGRICTPITCDYPEEARPFGSLSFSGTSLGDIATYTCDPGFQPALVESTCTASTDSADWSEGAPACRDVDECANELDDCDSNAACANTVGSFRCNCNPGYFGGGRICTLILCADPVNGQNGAWQGSGRNVGDAVTYECSEGYQPDRPDAIADCILSSDGQSASWSEEAPGCEAIIVTQCPDGFTAVGKRCYRLIEERGTWEQQCRKCRDLGGQLAVPHSNQELQNQAQFYSGSKVWLGIHSMIRVNEFMDMDSQLLGFSNWLSEPAYRKPTIHIGADCVSARSDGKWSNECCYSTRAAICEADPIGHSDCKEASGYELVDGRCLKYLPRHGTFEQHCKDCERNGGQLATALNENDGKSLESFFISHDASTPAWFNLQDIVVSNKFQTISLETSDYFDWAGSAASGNGDCVAITEGGWRDQCCYDLKPAICELNFCPKNYRRIGDNCFRMISNPHTWESAEKICRKDGANLAVLESRSYVTDLRKVLGDESRDLWIGVHDQVDEGSYQTPTLKKLTYPNWASGTPVDNSAKDCGSLSSDGVTMRCCYRKLPAMCAKKVLE